MVRYIKSANYDYYPFLDTKEYSNLLWFIKTEARRVGLVAKYYNDPDPNDLGGENRDRSNAVWIYDSDGNEIGEIIIQASKSDLSVDFEGDVEYFDSFQGAKNCIAQILESLAD